MERNFKGIWIPRDIWLATDLGWSEKLLLMEIDSLDQLDECYATNQYFGEFFGLSKGRISKIISSLKDKGYIEINIIYKEGSKEVERRIITTRGYSRKQLGGMDEKNHTYSRKQPQPMVKNNQDINIVNKTTNKPSNKVEAEKNGFAPEPEKFELKAPKTEKKETVPVFSYLMESYNKWFKERNGLAPRIDGAEGKALNSIISYLKKIVRDKHGEHITKNGEAAEMWKIFEYILKNWEKLEPFLQNQIKLTQINSNLSNIINQLKNGHKTRRAEKPSASDLARAFENIDKMFPGK